MKTVILKHKDLQNYQIEEVYSINSNELTQLGIDSLNYLRKKSDYSKFVASLASIIEFEDLLSNKMPKEINDIKILNKNFCYYESTYLLRDAFITGINGNIRSSLSSLRPILELMLMHAHWNKQIELDEFSKWFRKGEKNRLGFSKLRANFRDNYIECFKDLDNDIKDLYKVLCSYSHTPYFEESITHTQQSNLSGQFSTKAFEYWYCIFNKLTLTIMKVLITMYPTICHPVNITSKFGVNRAGELFSDIYNYMPISFIFDLNELNRLNEITSHFTEIKNMYDSYSNFDEKNIDEIINNLETVDHNFNINQIRSYSDLNDSTWIEEITQVKASIRIMKETLCYQSLNGLIKVK